MRWKKSSSLTSNCGPPSEITIGFGSLDVERPQLTAMRKAVSGSDPCHSKPGRRDESDPRALVGADLIHGRLKFSSLRWMEGFTYIEIAIVVAVAAILALITVPIYQRSIEKTRRTEGKILLQQTMAAEERHYASTNRYSDDIGPNGLAMPSTSAGGYYRVSLIRLDNDGQFAEITATPQGVQAGDPCGDFTLDSTGKRLASGQQSNQAPCW